MKGGKDSDLPASLSVYTAGAALSVERPGQLPAPRVPQSPPLLSTLGCASRQLPASYNIHFPSLLDHPTVHTCAALSPMFHITLS